MTATRSVSVLLLLAATAAAAPAKEVPPCPRVRIVFEDGEPGDPGYRFEVAALSKDAKIEVVRPGGDVAVPYVWMRDPYADPNFPPVPWQGVGYFVPADGKWESLLSTSGPFDRVSIEPDPAYGIQGIL
jgi:hypothetical protein